jgi:hypothetical protein
VDNIVLAVYIQTELHTVGKPDIGFRTFDTEADIATLDLSTLAKQVQNAAPEL